MTEPVTPAYLTPEHALRSMVNGFAVPLGERVGAVVYAVAEIDRLRSENAALMERTHKAEGALVRLGHLTECDVWCDLEGCSSPHNPTGHAAAASAPATPTPEADR